MEQPRLPVIVMSTRYEVAALVHRALDAPDAPDAHIELLADPALWAASIPHLIDGLTVFDPFGLSGDELHEINASLDPDPSSALIVVGWDENPDNFPAEVLDVLTSEEMTDRNVRRSIRLAATHIQNTAMTSSSSAVAEHVVEAQDEIAKFTNLAAHDLQAPLRKAQMFLDAFESELECAVPEDTWGLFSRAKKAVVQMRNLVSGLFDYSEIARATGPPTQVSLNIVLSELLIELEPLLRKHSVEVTTTDLPEVRGLQASVELVLANLLLNAIAYSSTDKPTRVEVTSRATLGTHVVVEISDNGIGIDPDDFDRVFGLFQRVAPREVHDGPGLGLAVCRQAMESMGGSIGVGSGPGGQGSTFTLRFPRIDVLGHEDTGKE